MQKKYYITWDEIKQRINNYPILKAGVVYSIPKGGMCAAYAFSNEIITTINPEEATIFFDDIIDSGRTKEKYLEKYPGREFIAVIDKTEKDKDLGWIIFPWESKKDSDIDDNFIRILQYYKKDVKDLNKYKSIIDSLMK